MPKGKNLQRWKERRERRQEKRAAKKARKGQMRATANAQNAQAVNEYRACLYFAVDFGAAVGEFENRAVFADEDVLLLDTQAFSQFRMAAEHAVFAVHRDEEFRVYQGKHGFQIFLGAVA